MWSDNETDIDLLDFQHLVNSVTCIVKNHSLLPATIGVFGDWGSGKSSLIKMIKKELEQEDGVLCLTFNGWLFEGYDDAKSALMETILDEISNHRELGPKAISIVRNLGKRVNWFRTLSYVGKKAVTLSLGGPVALGISAGGDLLSFLTENLDKIKEMDPEKLKEFVNESTQADQNITRNIRDFHRDFSELLKETKIKTLVVFIDDLDRCTPDTIIETLEAIRLFLFAPQTAFILGADERLVKYAVRKRFPELPGERTEVGRDYLEKLIQFPIRVTPLGRQELETYMGLLFASLHLQQDHFEGCRSKALLRDQELLHEITFNYGIAKEVLGDVPPELEEGLALAGTLAPVLHGGLNGNPRQCKRFLNTLLMRMQMAESKKISLKLQVLAKLMVLEYMRPAWFKRIAELQAEQHGKPSELHLLEKMLMGSAVSETIVKEQFTEDPEKRETANKSTKKPGSTKEPKQAQEEIAGEFKAWLTDSVMKDWLSLVPALSDIDLRPYFYFSRDTLGALSSVVKRMSPQAQEILSQLLNDSEAYRGRALESASTISQADAAAVFDSLWERSRREEDLGDPNSAFMRMFDWVQVRDDLKPQLITALMNLPEAKIPVQSIPKVIGMTKGTEFAESARKLFQQWSQSTSNPKLAKLVSGRMKDLVS